LKPPPSRLSIVAIAFLAFFLLTRLASFCTLVNRTKIHAAQQEALMAIEPSKHSAAVPPSPRLLDQLRQAARELGHAEPTVALFVDWVRRFILFHDKRHPRELGRPAVAAFLEQTVLADPDPLVALDLCRRALDLLYQRVLGVDLGELPLPRPPRLLDQVRQVLRLRHYAQSTEENYVQWIRRFILFHGKRHPRELGAAEVQQFLTDLAVHGRVAASTQNQALNALVFLYTHVLEIDLGRLDAVRARRGKRLPVVLSPEEVRATLAKIAGAEGVFALMARLLYGCGLRLRECCRLRIKDLDFERRQIRTRSAAGSRQKGVGRRRSGLRMGG
jgi:hypothetical protein